MSYNQYQYIVWVYINNDILYELYSGGNILVVNYISTIHYMSYISMIYCMNYIGANIGAHILYELYRGNILHELPSGAIYCMHLYRCNILVWSISVPYIAWIISVVIYYINTMASYKLLVVNIYCTDIIHIIHCHWYDSLYWYTSSYWYELLH